MCSEDLIDWLYAEEFVVYINPPGPVTDSGHRNAPLSTFCLSSKLIFIIYFH